MENTVDNGTIGGQKKQRFGSSMSYTTQFIEDLKSLKAIGGGGTAKSRKVDAWSGVRTQAGDFVIENPYNMDDVTDDMTMRESVHKDSAISSDRLAH